MAGSNITHQDSSILTARKQAYVTLNGRPLRISTQEETQRFLSVIENLRSIISLLLDEIIAQDQQLATLRTEQAQEPDQNT